MVPVSVRWSPPGISVWPQTIQLSVPLSDWQALRHRWCRLVVILIFLAVMLVIPTSLLFLSSNSTWFTFIAGGSFFTALLCLLFGNDYAKTIEFKKAKGDYFWFKGADPLFLDCLPPWEHGN